MKNVLIAIFCLTAIVVALVLNGSLSTARQRIAELERTCEDLRGELAQRGQATGVEPARSSVSQTNGAALSAQTVAARAVAREVELERRLAEVAELRSNATELVQALVAMREAPEAPHIPEHVERAQISLAVFEKHLEEARQAAAKANDRAKDLLLSLNIPPDVASTNPDRALASVELRHFWPYFEARKELETQNNLVERLKVRMLQERVEAEILQAQQKAAQGK